MVRFPAYAGQNARRDGLRAVHRTRAAEGGTRRGSAPLSGLRVRITGTVQGVGFRPFVFRLAEEHALSGWVRNTAELVEIHVEGAAPSLETFLQDLRRDPPPLARIETVVAEPHEPEGFETFEIRTSRQDFGWQNISPDVATCDDCLRELFDPADRRYLYPFINCTHCGPRFTIIESMPYDRARTTMREFALCEACRREYEDPRDRRFHAQPVACPTCGPKVWLHAPGRPAPEGDPIAGAAALLREGAVVALKGLGGFHLACDARDEAAVSRLRERKHRYGKPLAVMVADRLQAERVAELTGVEAAVLCSRERPIVLVRARADSGLAPAVAPGLDTVGLMLPYTPLHHLLVAAFDGPLVMTSGNLSEEPIAIGNAEALDRLSDVADAFLLHDRDIRARYDDSVVRVLGETPTPIRRSRGLAPAPVDLPFSAAADILACGGQQKSAFCLVKGSKAFLSQHIGDLENLETLEHFTGSLELYRDLFRVHPRIIAHDMHPDYMSTLLAARLASDGELRVAVQHHHAHIAACMAENGLVGPVIGVAYDGTGYGTDGTVWGGEVLVADWSDFRRAAHLRTVPMLGGEAAIRRPDRMAAAYLWEMLPEAEERLEPFFERFAGLERQVLRRQLELRLNSPMTSSCGRLFDAVSALLGVCTRAAYEGEPAVRLEAVADAACDVVYPFDILTADGGVHVLDPAPTLRALWQDHRAGVPVSAIAGAFHNTVAAATARLCTLVGHATGIERVCLSGGCFQSALLTDRLSERLGAAGFEVYTHRLVPPNDGGLALGQAVVAYAKARQ